jgi:hypothetical protein
VEIQHFQPLLLLAVALVDMTEAPLVKTVVLVVVLTTTTQPQQEPE